MLTQTLQCTTVRQICMADGTAKGVHLFNRDVLDGVQSPVVFINKHGSLKLQVQLRNTLTSLL